LLLPMDSYCCRIPRKVREKSAGQGIGTVGE